jgi:hypothetical protein
MRRISRVLLIAALSGSFGLLGGLSTGSSADAAPKRKRPAKVMKKKAAPKKVIPVSAEKKKKLAELYSGFKFGMSKDEVVAVLRKQLDATYNARIQATTDVSLQDRIRRDKKKEVALINASYTSFQGKRTGWDVSIIEQEFAHHTGESMLERWENQGGKNQRRFFFFHDGRLYKMFISLDVSILPEDKKNFETFRGVMQNQYGPGDVENGLITWRTDEFHVRAVDKLKAYDALALIIENPRTKQDLVAIREAKAPPKKQTSAIIKAVIDVDQSDQVNVKQNSNAVDAVINAQGGGKK